MEIIRQISLICLVFLLTGCNPGIYILPASVTPNYQYSTSTPQAIPSPELTISAVTPPELISLLQAGKITLHPTINSLDFSKNTFDLDPDHSQSLQDSDFRVDITNTSNGLIVFAISPMNRASGIYLKTLSVNGQTIIESNTYKDCLKFVDNFLMGSEPIGPGDIFCWKSNKGHLVALLIGNIFRSAAGGFVVEIQYSIWNTIIK